MSVIPRFTQQELFDIGVAGYLQELRSLARMISSDAVADLLPLFSNYEDFLHHGVQHHFHPELLTGLVNDGNTVRFDPVAPGVERLLRCASLAAFCEVFNGWTIDGGSLREEGAEEVLQQNILTSGESEQRLGQIMGIRLNRSDALRVGQLVKLLGLLPADAQHFDQLALGASLARRDREGFHRIPGIGPAMPGAELMARGRLNFAVKPCEPNSLVIIDNDTSLAEDFAELNRSQGPGLQALNQDLSEGLDHLAMAVQQGTARRRNLVTMFRLEPRALPDVSGFLDRLSRVVTYPAWLLVTVGSGDTRQEFAARQQIIEELSDQLQSRGQQPLRLMLHNPTETGDGRGRPLFGIAEFASFEILFCRFGADFIDRVTPPVKETERDHSKDALQSELWDAFLPTNRQELVQGILDFLRSEGRLRGQPVSMLNIGSGVGETSSWLEKLHPQFVITDIDQIPHRAAMMHVRYVQNDVTSLPFLDNSFDALFSSFTFSYLGSDQQVMQEWLRVLKPGGDAFFVFHAPHSAYLNTARTVLAENMAKDFFRLSSEYPGNGFVGLYDWLCRKNIAWQRTFKQEQKFLSFAHEIHVCRHLVENVASDMFDDSAAIEELFRNLGATDISVNVLELDFGVKPGDRPGDVPIVGWFVVVRKRA